VRRDKQLGNGGQSFDRHTRLFGKFIAFRITKPFGIAFRFAESFRFAVSESVAVSLSERVTFRNAATYCNADPIPDTYSDSDSECLHVRSKTESHGLHLLFADDRQK
jgi:hypothetical protein